MRTRSFSSDPRNLPPLEPERLARLEKLEWELADKLERALAAAAAGVALVGRVGSDLSRLRFENGERPRYTHVGVALRAGGEWRVHQLLNTGEGSEGHLYRHTLLEFFRDDPFEYRAAVLVPSQELQRRIRWALESGAAEALHSPRYSRVAFPFSTRYQSSNQWVVEVVAAAETGATRRASLQRHLAAQGLRPSVLRTVGLVGQSVGALRSRNTRFDDHPLRNRIRGRLAFVLESSLSAYVKRVDPFCARLELCAGVPLGEPCPEQPVVAGA